MSEVSVSGGGARQGYGEAPPKYDDAIVKKFCVMAVVWGIVGLLVGVIAAAELAFPALNI